MVRFPLIASALRSEITLQWRSYLSICKISQEDFSEFGPDHVMTWHPDVIVFSVWEDAANGGDFLGYLYFDLFPRDHKYNHAGHYNLRPVNSPS